MPSPSNKMKKRLVIIFFMVSFITFGLTLRLGYIQIVKGEEYKKGALEQWTKDIEVKAKRGIIYDRNGKKLAVSISSYTVWCSPADIKDAEKTAKVVAEIRKVIENEPLAKIDYVELVDWNTLKPVETVSGEVLCAVAVYIGKTRLIDNFIR